MQTDQPNPTDPVKRIFLEARELPTREHEPFVAEACAGDERTARRVMALLRAERSPTASAIDTPAIDLHQLRLASLAETPTGPGSLPPLGAKYTPVRLIGCGGVGDVYLCEQTRPVRRRVAVKLLRPVSVSETGVGRLRREARVLAGLDHPGIARLLDVGEAEDGRPYIVMEFVDGVPIDSDCATHETPLQERLALVRELCEAVHHAHQRGVIHRDIKPANVLVERSIDRPRIRLVDLGVARLLDDSLGHGPSLTVAGAVVGSLGFMSPEQRRGEPADTRSDVYALGVLLYCLLTGAPPPERAPADQRALAQLSPQTKLLKKELGAIIACATAPNPDDRYATVRELDDDLRRWLAHEPIRARGRGNIYAAMKFLRRNRTGSVAAAFILTTVLAAMVLVNNSRLQAIQSRDEAETQYAEARRISSYFLRDVVTRLHRVPGAVEIQLDLLSELLRQTEDFLQTRPDDPELLDDYADTLYALGDVHAIRPESRHLAAEFVQRSLDVRRQLAEADPDNPELLMKLGVACARRGDHFIRYDGPEGRISPDSAERVLDYYTKAFEIDRRLVEIDPDSRRYRSNFYWSHDRIASVLHRSGREGALQWAGDALDAAHELALRHPDHFLTAFALSKAHMKLGRVLNENGNPKEATPHLLVAAEQAEHLNSVYPDSWNFMRHLYYVYGEIELNAEALGDLQRVHHALIRRLEIAEALDKQDPSQRWSELVASTRRRLLTFREEFQAGPGSSLDQPKPAGAGPG